MTASSIGATSAADARHAAFPFRQLRRSISKTGAILAPSDAALHCLASRRHGDTTRNPGNDRTHP